MTGRRFSIFGPQATETLRFGDVELRLSPPALFRGGRRVKLQRQPLRLLALLASRRGGLVSHDEIRALLWPGRIVDFAGGTHVCVRQIRSALGADGGAEPIENVPGEGYRFLPTVVDGRAGRSRRPAVAASGTLAAIAGAAGLVLFVGSAGDGVAPVSPGHDAYARGQYLLAQEEPEALRRSLSFFREAAAADPGLAAAWLGASEARLKLGDHDQAARLARAALARDSRLAGAHVVLGQVAMRQDWRWYEAGRHFAAALALDDRSPQAHQGAAVAFLLGGQVDLALRHMGRARALDPASTLIRADYGWMAHVAGRFDHAAQLCGEVLELEPASVDARVCLIRALAATGRASEAVPHAVALMVAAHASPEEIAAIASAGDGVAVAFERWRLARYEDPRRAEPVSPALLANLHAFLGHRDAALDLLERSVAERIPAAPLLALDPAFRPLAGDPRFRRLVARMGIGVVA